MKIPENLNTITIEAPESHLWIVRFNRPEVLNALNPETAEDLRRIFRPLEFTTGDLRCIVLTGNGRAFSAGGDLKRRHGISDETWRLEHAVVEENVRGIVNSSVPIIAAVNGPAFGGGCEIALSCDFIHAATTARFGLPEVTRGILPGGGGTQNLPRAVGERRAKEIILTGSPFSAQDAFAWGMINALHEPDDLMPRVLDIARTICNNAPISVRQAKKAIHYGLQGDLSNGLLLEAQAYERTIPSEDRREGVAAFNEKRPPRFKGR
jgi:enoyl-CoA hydratase